MYMVLAHIYAHVCAGVIPCMCAHTHMQKAVSTHEVSSFAPVVCLFRFVWLGSFTESAAGPLAS